MHWNHQENISLTPIHGKSVSTKLIPGDKKVGDCCFTTFITMKELLFCQVKYSNGICLYYSLVLSWIPHPSPTKCPSTCVRWRFQISLCCYTYRFAIQFHFSSVSQLCLTLCESMDCSMPGFPVHHQLPSLLKLHWVGDAIQPSHPLLSPSSPVFSLSQGLFQWISFSHQVAKVLELHLHCQSFQWIFRTDFL